MQPNQQIIDALVERIVSVVQPLRIILFGSAARGEMKAGSDLDVLVVVPDGTPRIEMMDELLVRTSDLDVAVDVLVTTPSLLERYKDSLGLIYRTVLREGKEIYAAVTA